MGRRERKLTKPRANVATSAPSQRSLKRSTTTPPPQAIVSDTNRASSNGDTMASEITLDREEMLSGVLNCNSRRPEITQTKIVDAFLFRADSQQPILHYQNLSNPSDQAGPVRAQVNDTWFGSIRSDKTLDGNQVPQAIFTAVQTTMLNFVAASSSSAAAASSSSSKSPLHPQEQMAMFNMRHQIPPRSLAG